MTDPQPATAGQDRPLPRPLPEAEPMEVQDIRDALVIRERDLFLLTNPAGEVPRGNRDGYGLYYEDTRYLSTYEFSFSSEAPLVLLSTAEPGYSSEHVLTNRSMLDVEGRPVPRGTLEVRRLRVIQDVLEETVRVTNYNASPVTLDLIFRFAADFADIFEVRGFQSRQPASPSPPVFRDSSLTMEYRGRDGRRRQTRVLFSPPPWTAEAIGSEAVVTFRLSLAPRTGTAVRLVFSLDGRLDVGQAVERFGLVEREYATWLTEATRVETDNDFFNAVLGRSLADLRMLWNYQPAGPGYPAAGTPWYDTLFGRDTCITGIQTLWLKPQIARDCLASLAKWQGMKFDPWRDEQPGKILHELRQGELTRTGELPFSPYYGSVDSTPLFLLLAGEYYRWTGDVDLLSQLETNLRAALHWVQRHGDQNGDGYVDYEKRSAKGLVNQGWKDSQDSIIHADGTLVEPPTALVEVQGYVYAALLSLVPVFRALGDEAMAQDLLQRAADLRQRFNRDFWTKEGFLALALDGAGQQARSVTSNAGQALWACIVDEERAQRVVNRLMEDDMFSGWGIRTLSSLSPGFNPLGYHLGTVWPHDNSIIAMGFKRCGREEELNRVITALFDAAQAFPYYRLPELFGGAERSAHRAPVPYPVACRPQAWAAGAFPLMTQAMLGLCPDAANRRLDIVRPVLPAWLRRVRVCNLSVGPAQVDLQYDRFGPRTDVQVLRVNGRLEVQVVDRWPTPLDQRAKTAHS